jgi:putative acyl-CoA dehydrogenase
VIALDVLRAKAKEPETFEALMDEIEAARGMDGRLDAAIDRTRAETEAAGAAGVEEAQRRARRLVEGLALALQGSLVVRHSPPAVAEAFLASRLGRDWGQAFGTLPPGLDFEAIIERHRPRLEPAAS